MRNEIKEKRRTLIKERAEESPVFANGRKLVYNSLAAVIAMRILFTALQIICVALYNIPIQTVEMLSMVCGIFVALFFEVNIYSGVKALAYLALLGGFLSLFQAWRDGVLQSLNTGYILLECANIAFIIAVFVQIAAMAFICVNKKCGVFLETMRGVQKDLSEWVKSNYKQSKHRAQ